MRESFAIVRPQLMILLMQGTNSLLKKVRFMFFIISLISPIDVNLTFSTF